MKRKFIPLIKLFQEKWKPNFLYFELNFETRMKRENMKYQWFFKVQLITLVFFVYPEV